MRDGASTRVLTKLGRVLEAARGTRPVHQVARLAGIAPGTWSNMIRGGSMVSLHGVSRFRPHRPSDDTVWNAALAVGLDPNKVMRLPREAVVTPPLSVGIDLTDVPTDALLQELKRRAA